MNEEVLYNGYYEHFGGVKAAVFGFLESLFNPPIELAQKVTKRVADSFRVVGKAHSTEKVCVAL